MLASNSADTLRVWSVKIRYGSIFIIFNLFTTTKFQVDKLIPSKPVVCEAYLGRVA